jgi:ABC-type phosphate transport system permease subunit
VLALALPVAIVLSFLAGAAGADPVIGGRVGRALNLSLRVGPAVPAVAIGLAMIGLVTSDARVEQLVQRNPIAWAAAGLALLNMPIMTARFRSALRAVPREWRAAAQAGGASPPAAFFGISVPRAMPGIVAVMLHGAGEMLGETAAVAMVLTLSSGATVINHALTFAPSPLPVHLWQRLAIGQPWNAPEAAAETLLLLVAILLLRFAARVLQRRRRRAGALL